MNTKIIFFLMIISQIATFIHAQTTLDGSGKSYPVTEPSGVEETMNRIKKEMQSPKGPEGQEVDLEKYEVTLKKKPEIATINRVRQVDVTYTLPFDITDNNEKILVPRGTTVNPFKHTRIPLTTLIIVEDRPDHLLWAKAQKNLQKNAKILLSKGSFLDVMKQYHMRVYHLDDDLMERFKIERVPCIVRQKVAKDKPPIIEVHEYAI